MQYSPVSRLLEWLEAFAPAVSLSHAQILHSAIDAVCILHCSKGEQVFNLGFQTSGYVDLKINLERQGRKVR